MGDGPIIVGVDASAAAAKAAALGARLAEQAGVACHLVHAVPDTWSIAAEEIPFDLAAYNRQVLDAHGSAVRDALRGHVPDGLLDRVDIRLGRPPRMLKALAHDIDASLIIVGGKPHAALERWLVGSTVHHVVRSCDTPLFVTGPGSTAITRVLAAVDLSYAAGPTLRTAERYADLFGAELWVMHVIGPMPGPSMVPLPYDHAEMVTRATRRFETEVWPLVERAGTERVVREGEAAAEIAKEVALWESALVVLGSHGKGRLERALLGSTTERLLNHLPASLLVVPVHH